MCELGFGNCCCLFVLLIFVEERDTCSSVIKNMLLKFERIYRFYKEKVAWFQCFLGFWNLRSRLLCKVRGGWFGQVSPGYYCSWPFQGRGIAYGVVSKIESPARACLAKQSLSDTLLVVSILDMIAICSRFSSPEEVKNINKGSSQNPYLNSVSTG